MTMHGEWGKCYHTMGEVTAIRLEEDRTVIRQLYSKTKKCFDLSICDYPMSGLLS